ncbi:SDR family NAD(P)-dependent oxidoreductase [Bradyrhizobium xenonodulans]|uniref:SDR family NAD(P)-dependent oxidoreductase n=1 Tax=Bradyrhizobium xenonodulans TaxID=2736875 RepID=A0ABY7MV52_9BRAD|nr:SDR family NAD(P)-dependent oxidoreductase [Bradyrhizobium xenonodulans]WBL80492.1 SDR family NAD(P)-dependent oxidoreductase [Bradyrhizobium xenonodulans]
MKRIELDKKLNLSLPALENLELAGLNVTVIGGTGGIGRALSHQLAAKGARVLVVGQTFRDQNVPRIAFMKADLSLMREARRIGRELPAATLDIVVFTTGIMAGPRREVTLEGIERDLAVSYLSRFVILNEIAPRLGQDRVSATCRPRIFVMGFPGTEQKADVDDLNSELSYKRFAAHSNTVAGNEVLVLQAAKRFADVDVFGLNPGFVKTGIRANLLGSRTLVAVIEWLTSFMMVAPDAYAARLVPLLVTPDLDGRSGAMFDNKARAILPSPSSTDPSYAAALMDASDRLAGRALN